MAQQTPNTQLQVYTRSTFQNAVRWIAFGAIVVLDISCVWQTVITLSQHGGTAPHLLKQLFAYFILFACQSLIIPMIVLEARKVEILPDRLVVHNLLYTNSVPWDQIKSVKAPLYLKFAIIKTPKWFILINKRDVEGFSDLIQIITERAEGADKA